MVFLTKVFSSLVLFKNSVNILINSVLPLIISSYNLNFSLSKISNFDAFSSSFKSLLFSTLDYSASYSFNSFAAYSVSLSISIALLNVSINASISPSIAPLSSALSLTAYLCTS